MELIFIGSGSAFIVGGGNYHSNMLLVNEKNQKKLLIDCGSDARHALSDLKYTYKDITDVYISHLHADHAGGLEWLALTRKFNPGHQPAHLYANTDIINNLWQNTLAGGLSTIQGVQAELKTFFNVHAIPQNKGFTWEKIKFQTVQTIHVLAGYAFMPSYGLLFKINDTQIFITTDTQFAPNQLRDWYDHADIIFHDCETSPIKSGVHAHYEELCQLPKEIKQKIWLYHFNSGHLPEAKKDGFLGFVQRGQKFKF